MAVHDDTDVDDVIEKTLLNELLHNKVAVSTVNAKKSTSGYFSRSTPVSVVLASGLGKTEQNPLVLVCSYEESML